MRALLLAGTVCAIPPFLQFPIQLREILPLGQRLGGFDEGKDHNLELQIQQQSLKHSSLDSEYDFPESFTEWTLRQSRFCFSQILHNIGGSEALPSVPEGVVLASPSKTDPDYFYNWVRDSALTIRSLVYEMKDSADLSLQNTVEQYIWVNYHLQRLRNRSGGFDDRSGLGEPKFNADMSVFEGTWGRPQSDGPALRVSTIANYLNLLAQASSDFGSGLNGSFVYSHILRPDLEYVLGHWHVPSFDLWEEVNDMHFFTVLVQLRAVGEGVLLAEQFGDTAFSSQLKQAFGDISDYIASAGFIGPLHIVETPSSERSGLDAASLLAALHAHNMDFGGTESVPYDVDDAHVLNTIAAMVLVMRRLYPINAGSGVALGRYPEDVYNGDGFSEGNPWFICTASSAEVLYRMVYKQRAEKADIQAAKMQPFMKMLGLETVPVLLHGTPEWAQFLDSSLAMADSFIRRMRMHMDHEGRMSEQFNKYTGFMQGARDLTWSYSSFYNCIRWRQAAQAAAEISDT